MRAACLRINDRACGDAGAPCLGHPPVRLCVGNPRLFRIPTGFHFRVVASADKTAHAPMTPFGYIRINLPIPVVQRRPESDNVPR